jgi:hypothetical protein
MRSAGLPRGGNSLMLIRLPARGLTPAATAAITGIALAATGGAIPAAASTPAAAARYHFKTLDNLHDRSFNVLLDINNGKTITGYYGSGAQGHPNKGYRLLPAHKVTSYHGENAPGSRQTQVAGINDHGVTVGLFSTTPQPNALLSVNDHGMAVGFWTDPQGFRFGYLYNTATRKFHGLPFRLPDTQTTTPAGVSSNGLVVGYFNTENGPVTGFVASLRTHKVTLLSVPGATATMALSVNDKGEVAGTYTPGVQAAATQGGRTISVAPSLGFTWTASGGFHTVTEPKAQSSTVVTGVDNAGDLVGSYVSGDGRTHGFLATRF